ncbi:MAG: cupredoxin domain-containing protein [Patescibacteria group bacterium]|nr:cupredoxin domain-containing protein [Patescibacteria group bacterium]MDE2438520.1 cupredoxin domain-containing protein [Patescibacteria group bacterium]
MKKGIFIILVMAGLLCSTLPARAEKRVIHMKASIVNLRHGEFVGGWNPKHIEVQEGDEVTLIIKSIDAMHIFYLTGYKIRSKPISPGNPVTIKFVANTPGTFRYMCGMVCGPYHVHMYGTLVVHPKSK